MTNEIANKTAELEAAEAKDQQDQAVAEELTNKLDKCDFDNADREYWNGASALYNQVGICLEVYAGLKANKKAKDVFFDKIKKLKEGGQYSGKDTASLERKVLNYATRNAKGFDKKRENRLKTYGQVIKIAYDAEIHTKIADGKITDFATWVRALGGFEGITRATGEAKSVNASLDVATKYYASQDCSAVKNINSKNIPSVPVEDRHKNTEFKVLLVRVADNSIVDSTVASSAVNNAIKHLSAKRSDTIKKWEEAQSGITNHTITRVATGEEVSAEEAQAEMEAA